MVKKIYIATVEIEMFVLAASEKEAEDIAKANALEELYGATVDVTEADPIFHAGEDSLPWGDNPNEWNVGEFIAAQVEAERAAEAKRDFEARQLNLFEVVTKTGPIHGGSE